MLRNSKERFGVLPQVFHWGVFFLFVSLYVLAEMMEGAPKGPEKLALYGLHKSIGTTVLFLVFLRLSWRLGNPVPEPTGAVSKWIEKGASVSHFLLYAVMFLMPLSGYVMSVSGGHDVSWFGLFKLPSLMGKNEGLHEFAEGTHGVMAAFILVFVSIHFLAATWHHFIVKDNVLRRMLPVKLTQISLRSSE